MFDRTTPLIIAEVGGNHEGDFARARRLAELALQSGADVVKFQIYRADRLVSRLAAPDRHAHFRRFELTDEQYLEIARLCGSKFAASVWDEASLDLLDPWVSFHKVGSGDLTNYPLLASIARKGKPMVVSTAMATLVEVRGAVDVIEGAQPGILGNGQLCLLHCVAMYGDPKPEYAHLAAIDTLQHAFPDCPIGYSDHMTGTLACEAAIAKGARVIEKHFTDDKEGSFRDHHISVTLGEMQDLVKRAAVLAALIGSPEKAPVTPIEDDERIGSFRRGLCARIDLDAGALVTADTVTTLRPLEGIDARRFAETLGRRLKTAKRVHEPIYESDLE